MATVTMDPEIKKAIKQFMDATELQNLSLTKFIDANKQFIIDHSPEHEDLRDFWSSQIQLSCEELGYVLVTTKKKPDWDDIKKEVSKKQKIVTSQSKSEKNSPASRGTKRSSSSKTDSCEITKADKQKVIERFASLEDGKKWKFEKDNGEESYVEDVMLKHVKKCEYEHSALSLILNIDDPVWHDNKYFSRHEIQQLADWGSDIPSVPKKCQELLDTCKGVVTAIIRDNKKADKYSLDRTVVDGINSWLKTLDRFDEYTEYDEYWLVETIKEFCDMYRWQIPARLRSEATEMDFVTQIWSQLDKCFRNLYMDSRRDTSCIATLVRVNNDRKLDGLSPIAKQQQTVRLDLVLTIDGIEYGAGECGKVDLAGIGKKELVETQLHSPKVLKDMFLRAAGKTGNSVEFLRSFRVVGFNQTHMRMSLSVIDCPSGYVCRVRTTDEFTFPAKASMFCSGILPILSLTLKAKRIVEESVNLLEKYENCRGTADHSFQSESNTMNEALQLPPSFTMSNKKLKPSMPDTPQTL